MCGRFSLFVQTNLGDFFGATPDHEIEPRYNIAPRQDVEVIRNDDEDTITRLNWGLRPHWVDDPKKWNHPINARAETVSELASYRGAFKERRCLVLADGFYEWQGSRGSKRPYRIYRTDEEPFAFAGLWETWSSNGDELRTVTIITTDSNDLIAPIHHRMPVMLEHGEERRWLEEDDPDELQAMLDPYPDDQLDAYEISTAVNKPENDSPEIIEPLGHGQSGLGEFG